MKKNILLFLPIIILMHVLSTESYCQYKPKLLRFDEDYTAVTDSMKRISPLLRFKNIPLNQAGAIKFSFGLDYREMYELVKGYDPEGVSDGYWITRLMAHTNIQLGKRFRTFIQIGRGVITERQLPVRSIDEDQLFFLNGFAEYHFGKKNTAYIRAGRQELIFGMGRLIAPREGPNIRNTYDGARLHYVAKNVSSDIFFTYIVNNKPGILDNEVLGNNQRLWGVYNSWKKGVLNIDGYYIGFYNPSALYSKQPQRDREMRHTTGLRAAGKPSNAIAYDAELIYQFGSFGSYRIQALLGDAKITGSYILGKSAFKTSAKFTWASGNRSLTDDKINTFNPLFPNLLYYQTAIGIFPANLINPQVTQEWRYDKLNIAGGIDLFWRQTSMDGLYAPFGYFNPGNSSDKYLGYQLYTKMDWDLTPNLGFTLLVSRYYKSKFIKDNPSARGVDLLLGLLMNIKF